MSNALMFRVPGRGSERPAGAVVARRRIDRLIVCQAHDRARRRVRAGEHVLITCSSTAALEESESSLAGAPPAPEREQFLRIQEWLTARAAGKPLVVRASILAQLPFLASWASIQRQFACQLEVSLERLEPERLITGWLPALQGELVRSYAMSHGLAFEQKTSPLGRWPGRIRRAARLAPLRRGLSSAKTRLRAFLAPSSGVTRPRLLVISLQSNSTRAFLPVAHELRKLGMAPHFMLRADDERSVQHVRHAGFGLDVIERESGLADLREGRAAAAAFIEEVGEHGFEDLVSQMGLPAWVDRAKLGRALAANLERNLRGSCVRTRCMERSLARLDPRCALFITSRAALNELLVSRKDRTRSVFFLQGIVPDIPPVSTPLNVDLAVVGSAIDLAYTARCGVPERALRVTGYPAYDHFANLSKAACRARMEGLVPQLGSRPLVVFLSQYATEVFPDWARLKNIEIVCQAAQLLPDVLVLLKPHPLREPPLSQSLRERLPSNVVVAPPCGADEALRAADVAVTYWSTTALESVLLETPLVQLNGTGLPDYFDVCGKMGRPTARTAAELAEAVRGLLSPGAAREAFARDRRAFLAAHQITLDGRGAARAATAIAEVAMAGGESRGAAVLEPARSE